MRVPAGAKQTPIRVLVADSNQTQSQLLSGALRRHSSFRVACSGSDATDCLRALHSGSIDIVLVGDCPNDRLIESVRTLHSNYPRPGIILLLDSYDRNLVVNAMRAGVRGLFCRASQPFRALCRCISVVHQGQIWASTEHMEYIIEALSSSTPTRVIDAKGQNLLTPRENQVVNLVAEGIGNREIGQQLGVKENTVKKSLLRVYDKLGVSNRVELVLYALTNRGSEENPLPVPKRQPTNSQLAPAFLNPTPVRPAVQAHARVANGD